MKKTCRTRKLGPDLTLPETMMIEAESGSEASKHVLVAEDDEINLLIQKEFLADIPGLSVSESMDGRDALLTCLSRRFDLLILDVRLPNIGGDRIARYLRSSANPNSATPIVLSTAYSFDELEHALAKCPYDDLLQKPFSPEALMSVVRGNLSMAVST